MAVPILQEEGFTDAIIDRFFRPFLGGIFFDRQLGTTSRLFAFVMRMLATGGCCCGLGTRARCLPLSCACWPQVRARYACGCFGALEKALLG